jgi:hypothetical protein
MFVRLNGFKMMACSLKKRLEVRVVTLLRSEEAMNVMNGGIMFR